jgi:hypothetical protein
MKETFPKLVKVRRIGKNNEAVVHAPYEATGKYMLTMEEGGVFKYSPIPEKSPAAGP